MQHTSKSIGKKIRPVSPEIWMVGILLVFLSPFIWQGRQIVLPWIDNMDSYFVWNKLAADWAPGFFQNQQIISPFMGGLPRFAVAGGFSLFLLFNELFDSFTAVAINYFFIHATALFGMYWLVFSFIAKGNKKVAALSAIAFSLQGFMPAWGLGIAGMPVMAALYLQIRKKSWQPWYALVLLVYSLSTNFQSAGIFVVMIWLAAACIEMVKYRKWQPQFIWALALLFLFLVLRGELIFQLFSQQQFISHRTEFRHPVATNYVIFFKEVWQGIKNPLGIMLNSGVFPIILITSCYAVYSSLKNRDIRFPPLLLVSIIAMVLFVAMWQLPAIATYRNAHIWWKIYSVERILVLVDFAWYVLFAYCLFALSKSVRFSLLIYVLVGLQSVLHVYHSPWWRAIIHLPDKYQSMSYEAYYSEDLFGEINQQIKTGDSVRVAAFGIHPAILQHNGFYTIDGYSSNYPLSYKHAFRKIIAPELRWIDSRQVNTRNSFKNWGHKLYLQSADMYLIAETAPPVTNRQTRIVNCPNWNVQALRDMKCVYIFSAVKINNSDQCGMIQTGMYQNKTYTVYVYRIG